jgi:hypothetical protein
MKKEQFGGTPGFNLLVKQTKISEIYCTPRVFQGIRLRTTVLHDLLIAKTACVLDFALYLTVLGQARQFIESCGTYNPL